MSYITYEEYANLGGTVDPSVWDWFAWNAEQQLNDWTHNRLQQPETLEPIKKNVQCCMRLIIDALSEANNNERDVTGVSNDGVSVTFANAKTSDEKMHDVYLQVVRALPINVVTWAVD